MVLVRCTDCGHEWDSSAKKPRCKCDSYAVEEIEESSEESSGEDLDQDREPTESSSKETEPSGGESSEESGGFSLGLFETEEETTGAEPDHAPELDLDQDGDDSEGDSEEEDDGPDPEIPELDPEDVRPFFEMAFGEEDPDHHDGPTDGILSNKRGRHYRMKGYELDRLSKSWARVANKYAPYIMAEYTVEGMAIMTTAMIMAPRVREDQRIRERREKASTDDRAGAATERGDTTADAQEPAQDGESGEETLTGNGPVDTATAFDSV